MDKSKKHIKINQKGGYGFGAIKALKAWGKQPDGKTKDVASGVLKATGLSATAAGVKSMARTITKQSKDHPDVPYTNAFADGAFWDALWSEPCWIKEGEDFSLENVRYLWHNWQLPIIKETIDEINKAVNNENAVPLTSECKDQIIDDLAQKFYTQAETTSEEAVTWANQEFNKLYPQSGNTVAASPPIVVAIQGVDSTDNEANDENDKKRQNELKILNKMCNVTPNKVEISASLSKWFFCFFIKFLLGPAGFFILKMMPHIVKFYHGIINTVVRFWKHFSGVKSKTGVGIAVLKMIPTFIGTVVPFNIINKDLGDNYGKGEFGKLIVGLTAVSAGIILMGGLGISVILICFVFYCAKVIGMFSDNVTETKKK